MRTCNFLKINFNIILPVTTVRCVLRLRMEKRPPDMESSWEYVDICRQRGVLQLGGWARWCQPLITKLTTLRNISKGLLLCYNASNLQRTTLKGHNTMGNKFQRMGKYVKASFAGGQDGHQVWGLATNSSPPVWGRRGPNNFSLKEINCFTEPPAGVLLWTLRFPKIQGIWTGQKVLTSQKDPVAWSYCPQTWEWSSARKAIHTHAQSFVMNDQFLLFFLTAFA